MLTFPDIISARDRLAPFVPVTPLRTYPSLDQAVGSGITVFVKHENHLPTNSFKYRNGLAAMTALSPDERARGVIATTLGNHGQGVAVAARMLGVKAMIFVPLNNNPDKNAAIRDFGPNWSRSAMTTATPSSRRSGPLPTPEWCSCTRSRIPRWWPVRQR